MTYKHTIFYDPKTVVSRLDEFKKEVVAHSYNILLEQKYKNGVNRREPTDKSLEWILNKCQTSFDIKITHNYKNFPSQEDKFQVTFVNDWYFAWCDINSKHEQYFINKYDLKRII